MVNRPEWALIGGRRRDLPGVFSPRFGRTYDDEPRSPNCRLAIRRATLNHVCPKMLRQNAVAISEKSPFYPISSGRFTPLLPHRKPLSRLHFLLTPTGFEPVSRP